MEGRLLSELLDLAMHGRPHSTRQEKRDRGLDEGKMPSSAAEAAEGESPVLDHGPGMYVIVAHSCS